MERCVQTAGSLQLHTLIDYIIKDVDEGVVGKAIANSFKLELESGKTFWNFST